MIIPTRLEACALLVVAHVALAGCTDAGRCALGSVGCFCDEDTCDTGAQCTDGTCEACSIGTANCGCAAGDSCNAGLRCVTTEDRCLPESAVVCEESCYSGWSGDGVCDDGGEGSTYSACYLGTDCADCGARRNPCANPNFPIYCSTARSLANGCWSPNVDCSSIAFCDGSPDPHACNVGFRYDCDMEACVANTCTNPEFPTYCGDTDCFRPRADCQTVTNCFDSWFACPGRRANGLLQIVCGATANDTTCELVP